MNRNERNEAKAFSLGREWAKNHPLSSLEPREDSEELWQAAQAAGVNLVFFDVFKYGCLDVWREIA